MDNKKIKKVAILVSILLLPSLLYLFLQTGNNNFKKLPIYGPKKAVNASIDGEDKVDTLYHKIPPFSLTNQYGETITQEDVKGKIYVADFFFATCPSICPKMATHMLQIQNHFSDREDFRLISYTVNPEHDSVEVLREYAEKVHAKKGFWHLLTGERDSIYKLAFDGYFVNAMEDELAPGGFLHTSTFLLIDKQGRIRGLFDGTSTSEINDLYDAVEILYSEEYAPLKSSN